MVILILNEIYNNAIYSTKDLFFSPFPPPTNVIEVNWSMADHSPSGITVNVGDTVEWVLGVGETHNVVVIGTGGMANPDFASPITSGPTQI